MTTLYEFMNFYFGVYLKITFFSPVFKRATRAMSRCRGRPRRGGTKCLNNVAMSRSTIREGNSHFHSRLPHSPIYLANQEGINPLKR